MLLVVAHILSGGQLRENSILLSGKVEYHKAVYAKNPERNSHCPGSIMVGAWTRVGDGPIHILKAALLHRVGRAVGLLLLTAEAASLSRRLVPLGLAGTLGEPGCDVLRVG